MFRAVIGIGVGNLLKATKRNSADYIARMSEIPPQGRVRDR
ncbi:MAG TPA: hypothetical protein V6D43_10895 [Candidatus Sericytochromatia bacterium]